MLIVNLLLLLFFLSASLLSCYLMVNKDEYSKQMDVSHFSMKYNYSETWIKRIEFFLLQQQHENT